MTLTLAVALVGLVAMAVGEAWRVAVPGPSRDAPLAQATGMALAMATGWPGPVGSWGSLLGPLLLGVLACVGVTLVQRRGAGLGSDLARVVFSVGLAGLLVRGLPGTGLLAPADRPYGPVPLALALTVVALLAVLVPILTRAVLRAWLDGASPSARALGDLGRRGPLALATASTAVVIALALSVLGPSTVPLLLTPLVVLQLAVTRQRRIRAAQRETIVALSRLTDQAGLTAPGHAARVAALAIPLARDLGVPEADLRDVEVVALLHDVGQVGLPRPIPGGATVEVSALDQRRIAAAGAAILSRTPGLSRLAAEVADVGLPHHRATERGDVGVAARVVRVASAYDDLAGRGWRVPGASGHTAAVERLQRITPHEYDPDAVEALSRHLTRRGAAPYLSGG